MVSIPKITSKVPVGSTMIGLLKGLFSHGPCVERCLDVTDVSTLVNCKVAEQPADFGTLTSLNTN